MVKKIKYFGRKEGNIFLVFYVVYLLFWFEIGVCEIIYFLLINIF